MDEGDCFDRPFFESASNGLLDYLFHEDEPPNEISLFDPYQNSNNGIDNHENDLFTDVSSASTQRTSDFTPSPFGISYSYGISYPNRNNPSPILSYDSDFNEPFNPSSTLANSDIVEYPNLSPSADDTEYIAQQNKEPSVIEHAPFVPLPRIPSKNNIKSKLYDNTEKRNRKHNISEKKRIERMNICINELYSLLESSGVSIRKNKVTVLTETTKKIRYLEQAVKELKQKVREAESNARRAMSEICYKPIRSSVNYHVMFLQNPIPQAILAADGQFIDANSQFCSLTQKTVQQLREMTLFKFAHVDDLPCAFGSYSSILRKDNNMNGVCMLRHCYLSDCFQPVFLSLSLVRNEQNIPCFFICNILPVLACTCTDSNCNSRKCNGQLRGKDGSLYQICNPADLLPWCAQLIDSSTGTPINQNS